MRSIGSRGRGGSMGVREGGGGWGLVMIRLILAGLIPYGLYSSGGGLLSAFCLPFTEFHQGQAV